MSSVWSSGKFGFDGRTNTIVTMIQIIPGKQILQLKVVQNQSIVNLRKEKEKKIKMLKAEKVAKVMMRTKMKKNQNLVAGENVCFYQFAAPNAQPAFEDVEEKLEEALKNSSQFVKSGEHGEDSSKYFSLSLLEQ